MIYLETRDRDFSRKLKRILEKRAQLSQEVRERVEELRKAGERIDYLTFVPDGEPTLDSNLGKEIAALKDLGLSLIHI